MIAFLDFYFEGTFVKAGDRETRKGVGSSSRGRAAGGCWEVKATVATKWAHKELLLTCWEVREKVALETGLVISSGWAAAAHCSSGCKSHRGPFEFTRCTPAREERRGPVPEGESPGNDRLKNTDLLFFLFTTLPYYILFFLAIFSAIPNNYIASHQLLGWCS